MRPDLIRQACATVDRCPDPGQLSDLVESVGRKLVVAWR
jgi:hypothetical protein